MPPDVLVEHGKPGVHSRLGVADCQGTRATIRDTDRQSSCRTDVSGAGGASAKALPASAPIATRPSLAVTLQESRHAGCSAHVAYGSAIVTAFPYCWTSLHVHRAFKMMAPVRGSAFMMYGRISTSYRRIAVLRQVHHYRFSTEKVRRSPYRTTIYIGSGANTGVFRIRISTCYLTLMLTAKINKHAARCRTMETTDSILH